MQTVGTVGAVVAGDDLTGVDGLRQFVNLLLAADADTLAVGLNDISDIEVHLLRLQLQVATQVLIYLLHHASPLGVTGIGLALMHQDTLDDTILLGFLCQFHKTFVGVIVVGGQHTLHPAWSLFLDVVRDAVGQETLDVDTANGNVDDTNLDIIGQRGHEGTAEPVGRGQTSILTAQGSRSLAPLALLTGFPNIVTFRNATIPWLCIVHGWHQQEAGTGAGIIDSLGTGVALHIRLSEAEEDVEVRVYGGRCSAT